MQDKKYTSDLKALHLALEQEIHSQTENICLLSSYKSTAKGFVFIPSDELEMIKEALLSNLRAVDRTSDAIIKMASQAKLQENIQLGAFASSLLQDIYKHVDKVSQADKDKMRIDLGLKQRMAV